MRRISGPCLGTLILLAMAASSALAQERTERFATEPQLVFNAGGHHAPIHRLLFSADESQLFSSGDDRVIHVWDLGPEPKWARSLRPFVWTGRRGVIEFMATTSVEPGGAPGPGLVAGGNAVTSRVGDLSYFRLKPDPNAPANPLAAI